MWADRSAVEKRLNALVADFLDSRGSAADRELDLGVFAIVAEIRERSTPEEINDVLEERARPEVGYTPEAEWTQSMWYRCSDVRGWIASGLFRRAMQIADGDYDDADASQDPEDD
ncbi:MAG TPA: hypothetical protein VGN06_13480 [Gaiellaceae bacterium]